MNRSSLISASRTVANRYHTADPFTIAEKLNVEVNWESLGKYPYGKTVYDKQAPIVILNQSIRNKPLRYFTMAHELGHVILQEGLVGYYTGNKFGYDKLENEANEFATALLGQFYIEEKGHYPYDYFELSQEYGLPTLGE